MKANIHEATGASRTACTRWPVPTTMLDGQPPPVLAECEVLRAVWILACDRSDEGRRNALNRLSFAVEAVGRDTSSDHVHNANDADGKPDNDAANNEEQTKSTDYIDTTGTNEDNGNVPMSLPHPVEATARRLLLHFGPLVPSNA